MDNLTSKYLIDINSTNSFNYLKDLHYSITNNISITDEGCSSKVVPNN